MTSSRTEQTAGQQPTLLAAPAGSLHSPSAAAIERARLRQLARPLRTPTDRDIAWLRSLHATSAHEHDSRTLTVADDVAA